MLEGRRYSPRLNSVSQLRAVLHASYTPRYNLNPPYPSASVALSNRFRQSHSLSSPVEIALARRWSSVEKACPRAQCHRVCPHVQVKVESNLLYSTLLYFTLLELS